MDTSLSPASLWILTKYIDLENELTKHVSTFNLAHAVDALYTFLWDKYADWYVEYLKTDTSQLGFAKELFRQFIITASPYIPVETQVLWQEFFAETSLLTFVEKNLSWAHDVLAHYPNATASVHEFDTVIDIISNLRSLRGLFALDPLTLLTIYSDNITLNTYAHYIAKTARASLINQSKPDLYAITSDTITVTIDILSYIADKGTEIERTNKTIASLRTQIDTLESQLSHAVFLAKADESVIEEKKSDLSRRKSELAQQHAKLKFLESVRG